MAKLLTHGIEKIDIVQLPQSVRPATRRPV